VQISIKFAQKNVHMNTLLEQSEYLLSNTSLDFKRFLFDKIKSRALASIEKNSPIIQAVRRASDTVKSAVDDFEFGVESKPSSRDEEFGLGIEDFNLERILESRALLNAFNRHKWTLNKVNDDDFGVSVHELQSEPLRRMHEDNPSIANQFLSRVKELKLVKASAKASRVGAMSDKELEMIWEGYRDGTPARGYRSEDFIVGIEALDVKLDQLDKLNNEDPAFARFYYNALKVSARKNGICAEDLNLTIEELELKPLLILFADNRTLATHYFNRLKGKDSSSLLGCELNPQNRNIKIDNRNHKQRVENVADDVDDAFTKWLRIQERVENKTLVELDEEDFPDK